MLLGKLHLGKLLAPDSCDLPVRETFYIILQIRERSNPKKYFCFYKNLPRPSSYLVKQRVVERGRYEFSQTW